MSRSTFELSSSSTPNSMRSLKNGYASKTVPSTATVALSLVDEQRDGLPFELGVDSEGNRICGQSGKWSHHVKLRKELKNGAV